VCKRENGGREVLPGSCRYSSSGGGTPGDGSCSVVPGGIVGVKRMDREDEKNKAWAEAKTIWERRSAV